jgi:hypothetical protein
MVNGSLVHALSLLKGMQPWLHADARISSAICDTVRVPTHLLLLALSRLGRGTCS